MACLDTKTITQRLVHFGRTNLHGLGHPLAIPHFFLDLKWIERSKLVD